MNKELRDKLLALRHIALDMDGTIYMENNIFPFTLEFLAKLTRMGITYNLFPDYFLIYLQYLLIPLLGKLHSTTDL